MISIAVFLLGVFVTFLTLSAAILVGLLEASDPAQSDISELFEIEKRLVGRSENSVSDDKSLAP